MARGAATRISGGATADEGPSNGGRELCRRSTPMGAREPPRACSALDERALLPLGPGRARGSHRGRYPPPLLPGQTCGSRRRRSLPLLHLGRARGSHRGRAPPSHGPRRARARGAATHLRRCLFGGGSARSSGHGVVAEHACGSSRVPIGGGAVAPALAWGGADGGARRWEERRLSTPVGEERRRSTLAAAPAPVRRSGGGACSLGRSGRQSSSDRMVGRWEVHLTCGPRMSGAQSACHASDLT